jgi:hypothetical protein
MRTPRVPCSKEAPIPNVHHWIHNPILQKERKPREEKPINSLAVKNNSTFIRKSKPLSKEREMRLKQPNSLHVKEILHFYLTGCIFLIPKTANYTETPQIHHEKLNSLLQKPIFLSKNSPQRPSSHDV